MNIDRIPRRTFLTAAATGAACLAAFPRRLNAAAADATASDLVAEMVRANDAQIPALLARQQRTPGHRWLGGTPNEHGIYTVGGASGLISALASAACAPASRYAGGREILEPLQLAVRHLLTLQHEDGTIDLHTTNFHSTPDLAFVLEVVCPSATLLRASQVPALTAAGAELEKFIQRGGEALVSGGVHTPNHRWVVSSALAWVHSLLPDPKYVARADEWLAEGIDLDPDGQYTEKSTTVYSPIVDRALITVARLLGRPALLEPVRQNLEMTLYYVHPDGEVVTEASRRQDRYQRGSMARYYYSYRYLALHDGNGRFAAMARQIERTAREHLRGELAAFLTEPALARALPAEAPLPTDYAKVFAHSGLARIRRGAASGTILANNSTIFSFRKGGAALEAVRFASAFFGKGQFVGDALEVRDGRYVLRQELDGPYFQPLSKEQIGRGEHVRMAPNGTLASDAKALRARSNVQTLVATAEIVEKAAAFEITIALRGTEHVPVAVELAFRHGGKLDGVARVADVPDAFVLEGGQGRFTVGDDVIEFGPGRAEHTYTQLRGALPKWDGQSVYLTGFTPFETILRIR